MPSFVCLTCNMFPHGIDYILLTSLYVFFPFPFYTLSRPLFLLRSCCFFLPSVSDIPLVNLLSIQVLASCRLRRHTKEQGKRWGHPTPRQGDCVPLHPLLNSYLFT